MAEYRTVNITGNNQQVCTDVRKGAWCEAEEDVRNNLDFHGLVRKHE
jgi:hypothetical protein